MLLRLVLGVGILWALVVCGLHLARVFGPWDWGAICWFIATLAVALGYGRALSAHLKGRLRRESWMPAACLAILLVGSTWVALG